MIDLKIKQLEVDARKNAEEKGADAIKFHFFNSFFYKKLTESKRAKTLNSKTLKPKALIKINATKFHVFNSFFIRSSRRVSAPSRRPTWDCARGSRALNIALP